MSKNAQLSATDRTMRTVFVGNINYDVTEDQVRQILVQVCFFVLEFIYNTFLGWAYSEL